MNSFSIFTPFDPHTHQREGLMMEAVLPYTAKVFPDFLVMPNTLKPPLILPKDSLEYKKKILEIGKRDGYICRPLLTIKYDPQLTTIEVIREAKSAGITGIKFYPDGVTTNSGGGVRNFESLYPILQICEDIGLNVLWHGEHPDSEIMEREIDFLNFFRDVSVQFPKLHQTLEHLSTWQAVHCVENLSNENIGATITAHHLYWTLTDMAGGLFKTNLMCKPILKNKKDRDALWTAASGKDPRFFFGSDTAPHITGNKHCADVCSGVFTAPYALPLLAEIFEAKNALEKLEFFVSKRGRSFYGLPIKGATELIREPWVCPPYFEIYRESEHIQIPSALPNYKFQWRVLGQHEPERY